MDRSCAPNRETDSDGGGLSYPKVKVLIHSLMSNSLSLSRLLCPWNSPDKNTGVGVHPLLQGNLPYPGIEPGSSTLWADSLLSEPWGKPELRQEKADFESEQSS